MKTFISLIIITLLACSASAEITRADLKKTLEHMVQLTKDQQAELESAKTEVSELKVNLDTAQAQIAQASNQVTALQHSIDNLRDWGEQQEKKALRFEAENKKLTKENHTLKSIIGIEIAFIALLICLWLRLPNLSPPWGLVATIAIPVAVYGFAFLFL